MRRIILFLYLSLILCSCKNHSSNEHINVINDWIGRKIQLPRLSNNFNYSEKTKIVTRINGNCIPCISNLKYWTNFIESVNEKCSGHDFQFYFYIVSSDTSTFNNINNSMVQFRHPVIFDPNNDFGSLNNLHENSIYHTMLLDSLNNVVLIGTPIMNKKLQSLYMDEIIRIDSN